MRPIRFTRFSRKPTRKSASASMALFLYGARTLEGITAKVLAARYGVKLEQAEAELAEAKRRRGL